MDVSESPNLWNENPIFFSESTTGVRPWIHLNPNFPIVFLWFSTRFRFRKTAGDASMYNAWVGPLEVGACALG